MTKKIVSEYLEARRSGQTGVKSPYVSFTLSMLKDLPVEEFDYEVRANSPLSGLICRVRRSGIKTLEVFRKPKGSQKPVRVKLGRLGDAPLSGPSENSIKTRLQSVLHDLSMGINPNEVRKSKSLKRSAEALTVCEALNEYLLNAKLKESTAKGYRAIIKNHFKPEHDLQLASLLGKSTLAALHSRITKKAGAVAANNAMRILRAISNHARAEREDDQGQSPIPNWPIRGRQQMRRFWNKESRRKDWIKPEYLKEWWAATESLATEYQGNGELARDYLQFVILTGLRRREATSLTWDAIDFKSRTFIVRETKNGEPLEIPCSDHLMKILNRRHVISDVGPFQLDEPKKFVSWMRSVSGVYFTIQSLRSCFITYAESLDFGMYTIKALVNHSTGSRDVTEGYLQLSTERLRDPMQKVTDYVLSSAGVKPNKVHKIAR